MASSSSEAHAEMPVVICGGGIIGCATAYYLAKRGIKSIILEATGIASGASGKAGGFLARDWCSSPVNQLATKSFAMHMELSKEFTDCDYRRMDTLAVTAKQGHTEKAKGNVPGWLEKCIDQVSVLGNTDDTAQVHPYKLCNKFFQKAQEMVGTEVKICEVVGFEKNGPGDTIQGVKISSGEVIRTDRVVLTLGPWSCKKAAKSLGIPDIEPHKAGSIVMNSVNTSPHALFMTYTTAGQGQGQRSSSRDVEWYPRPDGTLYVCGSEEQVPLPESTKEVHPSKTAMMNLKAALDDVCPGISEKTITEQACYLPTTADGVPVIGRVPGVKGAYIATGHGVWGILNSPATGEAMAELIADGKCSLIDLKKFDPSRLMK